MLQDEGKLVCANTLCGRPLPRGGGFLCVAPIPPPCTICNARKHPRHAATWENFPDSLHTAQGCDGVKTALEVSLAAKPKTDAIADVNPKPITVGLSQVGLCDACVDRVYVCFYVFDALSIIFGVVVFICRVSTCDFQFQGDRGFQILGPLADQVQVLWTGRTMSPPNLYRVLHFISVRFIHHHSFCLNRSRRRCWARHLLWYVHRVLLWSLLYCHAFIDVYSIAFIKVLTICYICRRRICCCSHLPRQVRDAFHLPMTET